MAKPSIPGQPPIGKKKLIIVRISEDGETVTFDRNNFQGTSCAKETEWLEKAFGEVKYSKKKPEYHETKKKETSIEIDNE